MVKNILYCVAVIVPDLRILMKDMPKNKPANTSTNSIAQPMAAQVAAVGQRLRSATAQIPVTK